MIAVVSDSHIPSRAKEIPEDFLEILEDADTVVHCGDFASEEFFENDFNQKYDDFYAVKGNCDFFEMPASEKFERDGVKFGIYHGTGIVPRGDHETLLDIAENKLNVDVLLHGHTHEQEAVQVGETVLLNPGSCTGVGGGSARGGTPTMLTIELNERLEVELITLEDEIERERKQFEVK